MRNSLIPAIAGVSAAVDANGVTVDATCILAASCIAKITGTSTGTLKFQASNDLPSICTTVAGKLQPVNWVDIAGQTVAVAGAAVIIIPKFDCAYQWLRVIFVHANGAAGTITANINAKGF